MTVKPSEVKVASHQIFVVSVPDERDDPTVGLRLIIPAGLKSVIPNVKPGWQIEIKKVGEGEEAMVSEIIWFGGQIPPGQRDEFRFSAQAPVTETTLAWKAYQTYQSGEVVSWYQSFSNYGHGESTPSETKVVNDLGSISPIALRDDSDRNLSVVIAGSAFLLAVVALGFSLRRQLK